MNDVEAFAVETHTGLQFEVDERVLPVERSAAGGGGVVDDAFEVAVAPYEWWEVLGGAVAAFDAHGVGAEHEDVGDVRVAQHGEQAGQPEDLADDEVDECGVLLVVERYEPGGHALLGEFGQHGAFEDVAGHLLTQVAFGGGLVAGGYGQSVAPLPA